MNLSDKMTKWADLKKVLDALEEEIKAAVLVIGETQEHDGVKASYSKGRGRYDYEGMAKEVDALGEIIDLYTEPVTNWKAVCDSSDVPDEVKQEFYTSGMPSVSLKILEEKKEEVDSRNLF